MISQRIYPLSLAQERLWHLDQLASGSPVYNTAEVISFKSACDVEAMTRAVEELVRRHEILRTVFCNDNGQPVQVVLPAINLVLSEVDLSSLPQEDRDSGWARVLREQRQKPFDLSQGPLLRGTVIHLAPEDLRLLLILCPLIADEWSSEMIHQEINDLYEAFCQGRPSPLAELSTQYADFACWQRDRLKGEVLQEQVSYWKQQLAGDSSALELPTDKPRSAVQRPGRETESFVLPQQLLERLKSLAQEEQATLSMVLEAAFMVLLHRYTGQNDIRVGAAVSGRTHSDTPRLIGCFSNTVVSRARFTDSLNFYQLLRQVREGLSGAEAHADLPFEWLVAEVAPERDSIRAPLFQVMFAFRNSQGVSEGSKTSGYWQPHAGTSKCDLTLTVSETENGLEGFIDYSTDLYEAQTIRRQCGHYGTLLEAIARDPAQEVAVLPILTSAERQQLLADWNDTLVAYPDGNQCLHELVERQADRTPGQAALVFEHQKLTYAELNRRANQLAHYLKDKGIGPGMSVGLFVERSLEMIVGILGVLKAGAAYVPLDTTFPQERIGFMLADAKVALLLTQTSLLANLPGGAPQVLCLDSFDWTGGRALNRGDHGSRPEDLAYVIYTSGSTGRPKGVCIEHRNIVNYVLGAAECFHFNRGMNHAMVSTIAADLCNTAIFPVLATGGCLHIISQERAQSHAMLSEYFEREKIDVLKIVPSHLAALQAAGNAQQVMPRKRLILGGETLYLSWIGQLRALSPNCEIYNEYGPTETTVGVLAYHVGSQLPGTLSGTLPSGRPLANSRIYILDGHGQPVPVGVTGELCIGGRGVGRGYLNRPDLTAEKFIPDPFGSDPSGRLYRTGDRARYLPDGNIEFLGRVDHQVKIHGYRVELGEIERAIREQQGVRDVVVTANEDELGSKELVAYVVPKRANQPFWAAGLRLVRQQPAGGHIRRLPSVDEEILTPTILRKFLKEQLPHYMIPSVFVLMEKLPLTPNGKIDRKSLPAPAASAEVPSEYIAPRDSLEQSLADIWAKVLKMERVGIHDDFFDLGGHSLLAVRVIAEFEKLSDRRLPLAMLLQAPTIAGVADLLRSESRDPGWSSLVPIESNGSNPPLFLVHEGDGSVMLYKQLARHLGQDQPVYGLQSKGLKGDGLVHSTIEEMASHYIKEVKTVQPHGPFYLGGYCLGGAVALEMAQQLTAQGEKVALVTMIDTYNFSLIPQSKLRHLASLRMLQSMWFHGVNFVSTKRGERLRFLQQKWEITRTQLAIRLHAWWEDLRRWKNPGKLSRDPYLHVKRVNHRALMEYVPKPYSGRVVLIRPEGHFWGEDDPALGWGAVIHRQLEVRRNPAYPKGIMLDPYLRILAQDLKECLQEVQMTEAEAARKVAVRTEEETADNKGRLDSKQIAQIMAGLRPNA